jgi:ferredoxin-NADP reductase/predicted pyridoxine 5'-phosphate oxidase superfamily flavin-nucleotide-binding protein
MASAFAHLAFTPNVRAQQSLMGSRDAYSQLDAGEPERPALGPGERAFIDARDSLYQATVGETGWPYVQHRGGPAGFLRIIDEHTIGYADFSGNRQYISVGNLVGDNRVSLFLMDYANQRRLKILGRARIIDEENEPELLARLESPDFRARVERGILIRIEAFDWNCPKFIAPRFTESEFAARASRTKYGSTSALPREAIGTGALKLTVTGIRQMTPRIRAYELRSEDWSDLPLAEAGAHLEVPVRLGDGSVATRQYSIATHPDRRDMYEIAVLREDDGRGGSRAIHETWQIGTQLRVSPPINHFPLHTDTRPAVLIAGGIGITPIKAMAQALKARGTPFELHYTGRTPVEMAYRDRLAVEFPSGYHTYFSRLPDQPHLNVDALLQQIETSAVVYVCGPVALIDAVLASANRLGIDAERIQYESFY